ncbi:MAG: nickel-dependent lactate racemase [Deltaproteobacteria bacterium]|nr:nickel-dependent lactate racemase [Deltaproteobacteria bacterium]
MHVVLKYGTTGLSLDLPETPGFAGILAPSEPKALSGPGEFVGKSLANPIGSRPLEALARGRKSACIVVSDVTRPVPNPVLLPPILKTLESSGIPRERILILIATGMHRPTSQDEIARLVSPEIARSCRVIDHFSKRREEMAEVGKIGGRVPALVNRHYVEAELKILTGFIEPHMWAGFSGGRKAILPGISSIDTVQYMHGPEMVAHPGCEYGRLDGNPFHEAGLEVLAMTGADFIVNVTLNTSKEITGVFSGHPVDAHLEGCRFLARHCVKELDAPLDFIVTTNAGAPLDCNLYQTVKGITGAAPAVKEGGDILIASRCAEGAGNPEYREILESVDSPEAFLGRLMRKEFFIPDQWCAQETYQVMTRRNVWLYSEGIPPEELLRYHFRPAGDVASCVRLLLETHGPEARWAVVPDGPMLILKTVGCSPV